ncbi:DNA polymerase III subunit beta [Prevotella sp. S7 MS 2]|uniref:DNA polymerase III subunit beta n=1 Tax=Prevotella sp. S7 MS 2 TaxID=1287488 RepID=UPI000513DFB6|nr:DNA polymerase III subunit beta [Prevotella sp. S7 MS 2]KGI59594.1 DNA polymerase III subunit beta [Prevotella sp. S7 MS 2]
MRFTISSSLLNNRLQSLAKVINNKNTLPILDCFLFEVSGNELSVTASDSENVIKSTLSLDEADQNGVFAVPSRTLLDAVKELPEQPLTFEIDTNSYSVQIIYQNGVYNFTAQNANEYPKNTSITDDVTVITIPAAVLLDNVSRSIFATGQDELRPVMSGIYFDLTNENLAIVASDGHKLVSNQILNIKNSTPASFILPKKPAMLLKGILVKDDTEVIIKFNARTAEFTTSNTVLTCRLIEGKYPNYNSVIPRNNPNKLTIDRKILIGALRRVLPFASESSQLVRFHLESGKLRLSSEDVDFATSAKEEIVCDYDSSIISIGFKGSSMQEILNNMESEEVDILLADPSRAGIVIPTQQPENQNILMLIMPMLLND